MFLHALREYTQTRHTSLEKGFDIFSHIGTRDAYREVLERYFGYFGPMECALKHGPASYAECDRRTGEMPRTVRLARDLRALGRNALERAALPRCDALPPLPTQGAVFGCRYVLEGSALGGQIIYRHVRKTLNLDETNGASFFFGDGEATGRRWRDFGAELEAFAASASPEERDAALACAAATFQSIHDWFCPPLEAKPHA